MTMAGLAVCVGVGGARGDKVKGQPFWPHTTNSDYCANTSRFKTGSNYINDRGSVWRGGGGVEVQGLHSMFMCHGLGYNRGKIHQFPREIQPAHMEVFPSISYCSRSP